MEAVGKNVTRFQPGDKVFGVCINNPKASGAKVWVHDEGAFAECVCTPESTLVIKPDNVTFEQAAAVGVAALTALQGLRDHGHIQPGHKVLVNGAAGGVGTFAGADRKSARRGSYGSVQDKQRRVGSIDRSPPRRRLHTARLHAARATLRFDLRLRLQSLFI